MVVRQTRALRRSAFTLVELLVVISIIGVLMALLLPAVNAARASMWKAECSNNIKQLTTATTNWSSAKQMRLPGYAEPVGGKRMPWPVAMMPYIEQQQLYDQFRSATLAQAITASGSGGTLIPSYLCAADGQKSSESGAQMSYVANVGRYVADRTVLPFPQYRANGVFQNAEEKRDGPAASAGILLDKITLNLAGVNDGGSQTVAFSENVQAVTYGLPAGYNAYTLADEERFRLAAGFQWFNPVDVATTQVMMINGGNFKDPTSATNPDMNAAQFPSQEYARPSSYHAGGVNMGFVDGHVQFVPESIDYAVYMQLMTPNSEQSDAPNIAVPSLPGYTYKNIPVPWADIN